MIKLLRFAVLLSGAPLLSACSTLESLPLVSDLPKIPVPEALRMETAEDKPKNILDRALSDCEQRTEAGETACVKAALSAGTVTVPALTAMIPGCRAGRICHYVYTTNDRIGLVDVTASRMVVHWRVDVDLSRPASAVSAVPISVTQV